MPDNEKPHSSVAWIGCTGVIIAAIITAIGVVGASIISNWNKPPSTPEKTPYSIETPLNAQNSTTSEPRKTVVSQTPAPLPKTPELAPIDTAEIRGLKFELLGCEKSNNRLTCKLWLTSLSQDKKIVLAVINRGGIASNAIGDTKCFDEWSNEYKDANITIANKSNPQDGELSFELVSDVRTPVTVTFNNVNSNMQKIELFQIHGSDGKPLIVEFRKIFLS